MNTRELVAVAKARRLANTGDAKRIRERASVSIREMADAVGAAPTTLWRWENGERRPTGAAAAAWADALSLLDGERTEGAA